MKLILVLATILAIYFTKETESVPLQTIITKADADPIPIENSYRLPTTVSPSHYEIEIRPYISKAPTGKELFTFDGKVNITLSTNEKDLKAITLHKRNITITTKSLAETKSGEPINILDDSKFNDTTDLYTLTLETPLKKDLNYSLYFEFTGKMLDDMKGFYKSDYENEKGEKTWIGSTQFQPNHARRAFPCFDEPSFKATFSISIDSEEEFTKVVSNTNQTNNPTSKDGFVLRKFETTPKMSTYLVAFIVSKFDGLETEDHKFSVIARPEYKSQTEYSFKDGQKLLKALNEYTGIGYPKLGIEKMHMAAIPDFSAGAMENWGLLTYRERGLLYDPKETTASAQQAIAMVIAHEQTHMWFGDYVTCDWWNHTWLNEGFARYLQYVISHKVNNDWELDKQFVVDQIHTVMVMDSLNETNPMSDKDINTPADLAKMFNSISYNKGASIIRMINYVMGEEKFQNALKKYLDEMKYQSSKPEILFNHFIKEWKPDDKEVDAMKFFLSWTEQVGYPVVSVKVVDDGKSLEVSQERYLLEEDAGDKNLKYVIPFTFTTQQKPNFDDIGKVHFVTETKKVDALSGDDKLKDSDYVIANIKQMGYYRVMYEESNWHSIHHALHEDNFGGVSEINRAQIVDDLFNFGRSGHLKYDLVFDVLDYLEKETDYLPWTAAFNGFNFIAAKLAKNDTAVAVRLHKLLPRVFDELKFTPKNNEKRLQTLTRVKVLTWACKYEFQDCNNQAKEIFEKFKKDDKKYAIDKNIRSVVYCSALRNDFTDTNYKFLQKRFIETTIPTEKTLILSALGCVKTEEHIKTHYEFILSEKVRKQDKSAGLSSLIAENPENAEHVFKLIEKDHNALGTALGGGHDDVVSIISSIAGRFTTNEQKTLLDEFKNKPDLSESTKAKIEKVIKKVEKNMKWLETYKDDLEKALLNGVSANTFSVVLLVLTSVLYFVTN